MFCVRILSKPSHAHKFHANAKSINLQGQRQNQCAHWRMSVSAAVANGGKPYVKRWCLEQPEPTSLTTGLGAETSRRVGLCCPAATWHAYLSCEQPKKLSALAGFLPHLLCAYLGEGRCWGLGSLHIIFQRSHPNPATNSCRSEVLVFSVWSATLLCNSDHLAHGGKR